MAAKFKNKDASASARKNRSHSSEDSFYKRPEIKRTTPGTGRGSRAQSNPELRKEIAKRNKYNEKARQFKNIIERKIVGNPLGGQSPDQMMRMPKHMALKHKYIEINSQNRTGIIIVDADHNDIQRYKDDMLPPPNYIVVNRATGRHHIAYILTEPVSHGTSSHMKPQKFLKYIRNLLNVAYDGDQNYVNRISRNPCAHTDDYNSIFITSKSYSLNTLYSQLLDAIPDHKIEQAKILTQIKRVAETVSTGSRNCDLFNIVRKKAYVDVAGFFSFNAFSSHISNLCSTLNSFKEPLRFNEIKQIGNSIAKWVWKRKDTIKFKESVAERPENYDDLTTEERKAIMRHRCWQVRKKEHVAKLSEMLVRNPFASVSDCAKFLKVSKGKAWIYRLQARSVILGIKTLEDLFGQCEKETTQSAKPRKKYDIKFRIRKAIEILELQRLRIMDSTKLTQASTP